MGLPEFTPVKNYKFLPGDPEMYNGDPVSPRDVHPIPRLSTTHTPAAPT